MNKTKIIDELTFKCCTIEDNIHISEFAVNEVNITTDWPKWNESKKITYIKP